MIAPRAKQLIREQVTAAGKKSAEVTTAVSKQWEATEAWAQEWRKWYNLPAYFTRLDEVLTKIDKHLQGGLIAIRLDPQNASALKLLKRILGFRNQLVQAKRPAVRWGCTEVKVGLAILSTYGPKWVPVVVAVIEGLMDSMGTESPPTVEAYLAELRRT